MMPRDTKTISMSIFQNRRLANPMQLGRATWSQQGRNRECKMVWSFLRRMYSMFSHPTRATGKEFVDPVFGSCCYHSNLNLWTSRCELPHNCSLLVAGRSLRPTDGQISLWSEVQAQMPQLLRAAVHSVP